MKTYTLNYKLSYLNEEGKERTEEHTETYSTRDEALEAAWSCYYFDGGCTLHSLTLNGKPLRLQEGD